MHTELLGTLLEKRELGNNIHEFTFQLNSELHFSPGQYVWIRLDKLLIPDPRGEQRAFSITTSPKNKTCISILFRKSDSGFNQSLRSLNNGDTVAIIGPFGSSYVPDLSISQQIVLIAGGIGIAPFLSIIRSKNDLLQDFTIQLIYAQSEHDSTELSEEVKRTALQNNVRYCPIRGSFSKESFPSDIDFEHNHFFTCGPSHFVDAVYTYLNEESVTLNQMHFEQHYPNKNKTVTEQDFQESPNNTNIMLQAVQDSKNHVIITDVNGLIVFANSTAQRITGYSFDEMRGNTPRLWGGLMPPSFYRSFWKKKGENSGFDGTITNRRKNGEIYYAISHISPIMNAQNQLIGFVGTEEDITDRVRLEKETLDQKNELFNEKHKSDVMLASIGEGLVAHDKHERIILVNNAAIELLGYSREELIHKKFTDIVLAEDENGAPIDEDQRPLHLAIVKGKRLVHTLTYTCKDGSTFIAQVTNSPIIDSGVVTGVIQVFRNVTHEKQVDKMKTEFISLASHQLRTPLSAINWYLEMLLAEDAGKISEQQRKFLQEAYQGSFRMTRLVNSLLNVARIESGSFSVEPVPSNIVQIARSVLDELKVKIDEREVHVVLEKEEFPLIQLDPELIRIIFQNLLTNAIKYSPIKSEIKVSLQKISCHTTLTKEIVAPEDSFLITVQDSGMGIPQNQRDHIFLKLFRASNVSKADTEGTGLGLYILKSIVEQSGGRVWFDSVENKGSTFFVLLPMSGMIKKEGSKKLN